MVSIIKRKRDIRNCSCYRAVKFLEHGKKVVERVLGKRPHIIVSVDETQFGFTSVRGTIDAVFMLRRMHEGYHANGKTVLYVFCEPREGF